MLEKSDPERAKMLLDKAQKLVKKLMSRANGYQPNKLLDEPILIDSKITNMARVYGCSIDRIEIH